jgi:hypothetical protein
MSVKVIILFWLLLIVFAGPASRCEEPQYQLGLHGGLACLSGGDTSSVPYQPAFGVHFGYRIGTRWLLDFDLTRLVLHNDTTDGSSFAISGADENDSWVFRGTRLGLTFNWDAMDRSTDLRWSMGFGGGLMIWSIGDPNVDTTFHVIGPHDELMDYSATEVMFSGQTELGLAVSPSVSLGVRLRGDYLSGLGTDFDSQINDARSKLVIGGMLMATFHFGRSGHGWQSTQNWARPKPSEPPVARAIDGDADGVFDDNDECPNTPQGVLVNKRGCALDSDRDGVSDGLDDCPRTDIAARGQVDIHGCPIDSDFDGVADFLDDCPLNSPGALVDSLGCPLDGDGDGVPDGLDDCPYTLVGTDVDPHGCIDLAMLAKPMVLNIDYVSGSFDVDPKTKNRLRDLSRLMIFVSDVRMEINGYTDNIGLPSANKRLSRKRAQRVADFLAAQGIDPDRISVFGRGEDSFVASNQTAKGRAQNRRVEIVFYL